MWLRHFDISILWGPIQLSTLCFLRLCLSFFIRRSIRNQELRGNRSCGGWKKVTRRRRGRRRTALFKQCWWSWCLGRQRESPWGSITYHKQKPAAFIRKKGAAVQQKNCQLFEPSRVRRRRRRRQDGRLLHPPRPLHRHLWRGRHPTAHICAQKPISRVSI